MKDETFDIIDFVVRQRYPELNEVTYEELRNLVETAFSYLTFSCSRLFEYDEYVETPKVLGQHVFLRAVPVDEIVSVLDEDENVVEILSVDKELGIIEVPPIYDGRRITVHYKGGFRELPHLLVSAIADLTGYLYRNKGIVYQLPDIRVVSDQIPETVKIAVKVYKLSL